MPEGPSETTQRRTVRAPRVPVRRTKDPSAASGVNHLVWKSSGSLSTTGTIASQYFFDDDAMPGDMFFDSGSADVFRFDGTTWTHEQKLTASDGACKNQFGESIAIGTEVIAVGAPHDSAGANSGAVYVFRHDGTAWIEEQKIVPGDPGGFGRSVAVDSDLLAAGRGNSVVVYRYDGMTWIEEQILTALDAEPADEFGFSVAVEGQVILVGAYSDDSTDVDSGSAYVFCHNGHSWVQEQKLVGSELARGNYFGWSVSLSGDLALIGAPYGFQNRPAGLFGSAYAYRFNEKRGPRKKG